MTLIEILKNSCLRFSRKSALKLGNKKLSYKELEILSAKTANFILDKFSVSKTEPIGILMDNSIEYPIVLFGILKAGCSFVPINTFLKNSEIEFILKDSGIRVLFISSRFLESLKDVEFVNLGITVIISDKKIPEYINLGEIFKGDFKERNIDVMVSDIAGILYTSGTTGKPKGAMLTHKNFCSNIVQAVSFIEVDEKERFLLILPMFHSFTLTVCVFTPIYLGATVVIQKDLRGLHRIIKTLIIDRVTIIVGIPHLFKILMGMRFPTFFLKLISVKICISGAAPLGEELAREFKVRFKIPLLEGYGLTEASPVVSINPPGKERYGSVGLALPGVETRIIDDNGNELRKNEPGELVIKGDNVMKGYLNKPEDTALVLKEGWLYTGDIARVDDDGYIFIVDRKKDMLISHGMNVYPKEIEDVLIRHPLIKEAAVIGRKDPRRGEIPVAFIVKKENNAQLTERELIDLCKQNLAGYKVPHRIEFIDSLPKSPTGKVLKRMLK